MKTPKRTIAFVVLALLATGAITTVARSASNSPAKPKVALEKVSSAKSVATPSATPSAKPSAKAESKSESKSESKESAKPEPKPSKSPSKCKAKYPPTSVKDKEKSNCKEK